MVYRNHWNDSYIGINPHNQHYTVFQNLYCWIRVEGGRKMARLTLVTNEVYKNNNGEIVKNATWHSLIAWGRSAEKAEKYLTKGKEVMVKGKLINRNYTDKDGNKKYVTEVEIDDFYMLGRNAEVVG